MRTTTLWVAALLLGCAAPARAEHFAIDLKVKTPRGQGEAHWDSTPPVGGVNPRPVVPVKVGERVEIEWLVRSVYPHGVMKDVTLHLLVVREVAIGQKLAPDARTERWAESRLVMDFLPDHAARGSLQLTARAPGAYLVQIESEGTEKGAGHEHFAAIDLRVE